MPLIPAPPAPRFVVAADNVRLATYDEGDPFAPVVLAVHGFASSAHVNWYATGWVRELLRAGYRVVSLDQRGHGNSDKPHDPGAYSMSQLVADVEAVMDTYLLDDVSLVGYSLGARVGWHASLGADHRVVRAVLGGIPDGYPLTRFRTDEAEAFVSDGTPIADRLTRAYIDMAARTKTNDLAALVALVRGMQGGLQPDPDRPPRQPVLFATGSLDGILDASRRLAAATPQGEFFEIPDRNHFNAPTSGAFRARAVAFLDEVPSAELDPPPPGASRLVSTWHAGLSAMRLLRTVESSAKDEDDLERMLRARWAEWTAALDCTEPADAEQLSSDAPRYRAGDQFGRR